MRCKIINKKTTCIITSLLVTCMVFAFECVVIRDTPFLVGQNGGLIMQQIVKKDTVLYFDEIQITSLGETSFEYDNDKKYLQKLPDLHFGEYLTVTTQNNEKGRIFINDVTVNKKFYLPFGVISRHWIPLYMMTVLQSKNPKTLENYDEYIKNYDLWRKYTDWQNDTWYADFTYPIFLLNHSFIQIKGFNGFGGRITGIITQIESNRIEWLCTESDEGTKYPIPRYLTKQFQAGKTYTFEYILDGEYLDLYMDRKQFYSLVPYSTFFTDKFQTFFFRERENIDLSDITWPRRADKTHTVGTTCIVAESLRLRKEENTTSATLQTMQPGTQVQIQQLGKQQTIDGITANWVQVQLGDGTKGWCFGGWLVEK